ncbi:hypothetical protein [Mitsuaria sp. GD03876]|uniref:hypothetical protein n=1 Tax=Mitsuaria sp. GD03876 TaxID=2975399 RepID=UPI00244984EE|nr:hypothetical protein [Mitsuaria sp. GD03876]MDH0865566.1 hypothetical protein [Mitsuaria sp. GD03876]
MSRQAMKGAGGAVIVGLGVVIALIVWSGWTESDIGPATPGITQDPSRAVSRTSMEPASAPAAPASMPRASTVSVSAAEYPAPWSTWLHFETDDERRARHRRSDPFDAVDDLQGLLSRAARGDSEAALRLHDLAEYCDDHREAPELPPDYLRLDCSTPRSWSADQRRGWRRQAVFTGDPSPPMSMLQEAESMRPGNPLLAETASDAALALDYAARRGCLACIVALAGLFKDGQLVQQDLRRSFAYLQVAAAASGEPIYTEHAEKLRASLRPIDIEFARALQERLAKALEKNKAR